MLGKNVDMVNSDDGEAQLEGVTWFRKILSIGACSKAVPPLMYSLPLCTTPSFARALPPVVARACEGVGTACLNKQWAGYEASDLKRRRLSKKSGFSARIGGVTP